MLQSGILLERREIDALTLPKHYTMIRHAYLRYRTYLDEIMYPISGGRRFNILGVLSLTTSTLLIIAESWILFIYKMLELVQGVRAGYIIL